ncbi:hypothetical protein [Sphingomonas sp.]|nr:hypothetical protein [Sphingomonas sp.]
MPAAGTAPPPQPFHRRPHRRSVTMYIGLGGLILLIIVLVLIF